MALGEKVQAAFSKVNAKLGTQEGSIVFTKSTKNRAGNDFGQGFTTSNSSVTITSGARAQRVSEYTAANSQGLLQEDDLILIIPGNKFSAESEIQAAKVTYKGDTYSVVRHNPYGIDGSPPILSGVITNWRIVARKNK